MAQTLKRGEKVLYSDGDEKWGSELVFVARRETTPSSDTTPKPVTCVKYKTLCDALKELAAFEKQKGSKKFIKEILDRDQLLRGELVINHNPILGGGDPNDKEIEKSEFKDPRLPYFVDIEYIEMGYALQKQQLQPEGFHLFYWLFGKIPYGVWESAKHAAKEKEFKAIGFGTTPSHRPNRIGLEIGKLIAAKYQDIAHFAEEFCENECHVNPK